MAKEIPGPYDPNEIRRFLDTFMYREPAFLVDEVIELNGERRAIRARLQTTGGLAYTSQQRVGPGHPAHVAGGDIITITGSLGCLHAWFFYGCRWDEGWTGFGNRIHRADFKELAEIGPPLELTSCELHSRAGKRRLVIRYEFEFRQGARLIYYGDQSAIFLKDGFRLADRS